jgi:hypothetical protein
MDKPKQMGKPQPPKAAAEKGSPRSAAPKPASAAIAKPAAPQNKAVPPAKVASAPLPSATTSVAERLASTKPTKPRAVAPAAKARPAAALSAGVADHTVATALDGGKAAMSTVGKTVAEAAAKAAEQAPQPAALPPQRPISSPLPRPAAAEPPADAKPTTAPLLALTETGLEQARRTFATVQEQREAWNRSLVASASATTKAATVINGKVLDLVRSQTDATLGLWRALLDVTSVAEAVELQTREMHRQYENTTTRMRDIAETASRLAQEAAVPLAKGPARPGA